MEHGVEVQCPNCGECTALWVDVTAGQVAIESDCQVCCRPLHVVVSITPDGEPQVIRVERGW